GVTAVRIAHGVGLGADVEGLAGGLAGDQGVGALVVTIHRAEQIAFFERREVSVNTGEEILALFHTFGGNMPRQIEVAHLESVAGGLSAYTKGAVRGTQVASAKVGVTG